MCGHLVTAQVVIFKLQVLVLVEGGYTSEEKIQVNELGRQKRGRNSSLVVPGFSVHSVAGSILLWGNFPVEGIFPLELTWVQTPFPPKLFPMRV